MLTFKYYLEVTALTNLVPSFLSSDVLEFISKFEIVFGKIEIFCVRLTFFAIGTVPLNLIEREQLIFFCKSTILAWNKEKIVPIHNV